MIDEEDSEDWKLEVMHGVNAGVHASVSLGLVFFQSKARVWVDCSVPAAWKTAIIALQSKARSWVDCSVPAAWKTTKIASPCEARSWVDCSSVPLFKAKPEVGLIVIPCRFSKQSPRLGSLCIEHCLDLYCSRVEL